MLLIILVIVLRCILHLKTVLPLFCILPAIKQFWCSMCDFWKENSLVILELKGVLCFVQNRETKAPILSLFLCLPLENNEKKFAEGIFKKLQ